MVKHSSHTLVALHPQNSLGFVEYCNMSGKIQQECYVFLVFVNDISQIFVWSLFSCNMTGKTLPSNTVQTDANDAAPVWEQTVLPGCEYKMLVQGETLEVGP